MTLGTVVAKSLVLLMLNGGGPNKAGLEGEAEGSGLANSFFRFEYAVDGSASYGLGSVKDKGIFIERTPYRDEGYILRGSVNIHINIWPFKRIDLDMGFASLIDGEGNTTKSIGFVKNGKDYMTAETDSLARHYELLQILEDIGSITSFYYDTYNEGSVEHVGRNNKMYELENVDCLLNAFVKYSAGIESNGSRKEIPVMLFGGIHLLEVEKKGEGGVYEVSVDLTDEHGRDIIKGINSITLRYELGAGLLPGEVRARATWGLVNINAKIKNDY